MINQLLLLAALSGAVPIQGNGGTVAEVDANTRALRITAKPGDPAGRGCYRYSGVTGILPAALAASGVVFAARFDPATTTDVAVITQLSTRFLPLTLFTAATLTDHTSFDAFVVRGFSANYTGGTPATLTGDNLKMRTSFASTSFADIRIATTAAFTGGTVTIPTHPFAQSLRKGNRVNPAAATEEVIQPATDGMDSDFRAGDGEYPIVLADQEGIIIRNRTVWPAAGTGQLRVTMVWCEFTSY